MFLITDVSLPVKTLFSQDLLIIHSHNTTWQLCLDLFQDDVWHLQPIQLEMIVKSLSRQRRNPVWKLVPLKEDH